MTDRDSKGRFIEGHKTFGGFLPGLVHAKLHWKFEKVNNIKRHKSNG